MKYLKKFNTTTDYDQFKSGSEFVLPNVSFVEETVDVKFNPYTAPSPNVVCTYNVTYISQERKIVNSFGLSNVTNMIVDGIEMEVKSYYQFNTVGNHVVEFVLNDPTIIGNSAFAGCLGLTSINIPNSVTSIDDYAFQYCSGLTSINIPNSVTSIGDDAFFDCSGVTSITSYAVTAPTIGSNAFQNVKSGGTLYVPAGSDYSSWMRTVPGCLGYYNWTIEYI